MGEEKGEQGSDSSHHLTASIPLIDLHLLSQSDGGSQEEMAKLRSALSSWGLFQATGHGIPTSFLNEVGRSARRFFELPVEEKQRYTCEGEGFTQGYGKNRFNAESQADSILLQVEPEDQRKVELWPDNPTSFRETLHECSTRVEKVVQLILQAMAKSLDLEETHFNSQFGEKMAMYCRLWHYPSSPGPDQALGLKTHSDNSVLTVILQGGDVEGFELLKDGVWVKLSHNPDILLIVMGDLTEIMSNGIFKSSVHRVVAHPEKDRVSTALFYALDPEKEIGPAEKLLKEGNPRQYRDLKVKDYLAAHFKSLLEGKRAIDWAKV